MASILEPSRSSLFPAMTKIVGTLGPRSRSVEVISTCLQAGMSVGRFEFSWEGHTAWFSRIPTALKYKLVSIASILVASALGVSMPLLLRNVSALKPHSALHFLIKAFAADVILATGFPPIRPDAFNSLTSPCLSTNPWPGFPFAGFIAMMSALGL